jgi:hypothetical protein
MDNRRQHTRQVIRFEVPTSQAIHNHESARSVRPIELDFPNQRLRELHAG